MQNNINAELYEKTNELPYLIDFARIPLQDILRNRHFEDPLHMLLKSLAYSSLIKTYLSPLSGVLPSFERKELFRALSSAIAPASYQYIAFQNILKKLFNMDVSAFIEDFDAAYDDICGKLRHSNLGTNGILNSLNIHSMHIITDISEDTRPFTLINSDELLHFPVAPTADLSKLCKINSSSFSNALKSISASVNRPITSFDELIKAIEERIAVFYSMNCKSVYIEPDYFPTSKINLENADGVFKSVANGTKVSRKISAGYKAAFIFSVARICAKHNILLSIKPPCGDEPILASIKRIVDRLVKTSSMPRLMIISNSFQQYQGLIKLSAASFTNNGKPAITVRPVVATIEPNTSSYMLSRLNLLPHSLLSITEHGSIADMFCLPHARKEVLNSLYELYNKGEIDKNNLLNLAENIAHNNIVEQYFPA
ncbi:MAG: hypothetical protein GX337_00795 [Christensenellaceae bacterium]|nr:hypothetical protein [Christensenellaceae bacterium]